MTYASRLQTRRQLGREASPNEPIWRVIFQNYQPLQPPPKDVGPSRQTCSALAAGLRLAASLANELFSQHREGKGAGGVVSLPPATGRGLAEGGAEGR